MKELKNVITNNGSWTMVLSHFLSTNHLVLLLLPLSKTWGTLFLKKNRACIIVILFFFHITIILDTNKESVTWNTALVKHEVNYVLGQLLTKNTTDALSRSVKDINKHQIIRHEAAKLFFLKADVEHITLLKSFRSRNHGDGKKVDLKECPWSKL